MSHSRLLGCLLIVLTIFSASGLGIGRYAVMELLPGSGSSITHSGMVQDYLSSVGTYVSALSPPALNGTNVQVVTEGSPDRQQVEPTISMDPHNNSVVVAGAQDYRLKAVGGHRWHGYYRSTDGGNTWTNSLLPGFTGDNSPAGLASPLHRFNATSDPVLAFDRSGNLYYVGIAFNITGFTSSCCLSAFVAKYVNDGANYAGTTLIGGVTDPDKPWVAVDTTGGPYDGNVYLVFDATIGNTYSTVFTRSTDGGLTFFLPFRVPSGSVGVYGELPGVAVGVNGDVFVSTDASDSTGNVLYNFIQVSRLTNGGSVLSSTVTAVSPVVYISSHMPGGSFRTFTIPQIAADPRGVYLVWDDNRTGTADVLFSKANSTGTGWSVPVRVNDVSTGQQFFPTIATSGDLISVAWYDSRLNSGSLLNTLDVFYSQSPDGVGFSPNIRVTSVSFNPNTVQRTDAPNPNEPFMGDYIQIAAGPTTAHVIWPDNRNACNTIDPNFGCVDQDAYTQTIVTATRDVAIVGITFFRSFAYVGIVSNPIKVNVTAQNFGTLTETFKVTALASGFTLIGANNVTIAPGSTAIISFDWNAYLLGRGNYLISATATPVPGETSTANNGLTDGTFVVRKAGDVNNDGVVDIFDAALLGRSYGSSPSSPLWVEGADMNFDRHVDLQDATILGMNYHR